MAINLSHTSKFYVNSGDFFCEALEFILLKKGIIVDIKYDNPPRKDLQPPTFIHNNFTVFGRWNVLEFLLDFFPEPRAFPDTPMDRATHRMLIRNLVNLCYDAPDLGIVYKRINDLEYALTDTKYILNNHVYAIDCFIAPFLGMLTCGSHLTPRIQEYIWDLTEYFKDAVQDRAKYVKIQKAEEPSWH